MKLTNKKLADAIKFGLMTGFASIAIAGVASAQDSNDTNKKDDTTTAKSVGKVTVTGSRLKRADAAEALPVTVITRDVIEASGKSNVAELIQNSTFNSFGSFKPTSGSSAQSFSEISMRGLGSGRTLVLIDGQRAPTSPLTGEGQDLNTIPLAAVERVEILRDGASALYGADALAGVINIITRKDYNGAEVSLGLTNAYRGGNAENGSAMFGTSSDKGSITAGVSFANRGVTYQRDWRDAWETSELSSYGNNYVEVGGISALTGRPSAGATIGGVPGGCNGTNFVQSGRNCMYNYSYVAGSSASLDQKNIFARAEYHINDMWDVFANAYVTKVHSLGVFAPTPEFIRVNANSPNNKVGRDVLVKHRFAALGTRDNHDNTTVTDLTTGFRAHLTDTSDLEFGIRYSNAQTNSTGYNYVNIPIATQLFNSGEYNIFNPLNNPKNVLDKMRATTARDSHFNIKSLFANYNRDLFQMAGGTSQLAAGAEFRKEDFADIYDAQSAAGNIGGSSGNSSWANRTVGAVYGEINLPITKMLELDFAARHDRYSDFGSATSPKVSVRFQPLSNLTFRASAGRGFRAPSLAVVNQLPAFSADSVTDRVTALAWGLPASSSIQINGLRVGTKDLRPEKSKQYSLGVIWDATNWLTMSLDAYQNTITDQIKFFSAQTVVSRTANGTYLPPYLFVTRSKIDGTIEEVRAGYANEGEIMTRGADFTAATQFPLGSGRWRSSLDVSYVDKFEIRSPYGNTNTVGETGSPKWRAVLANTYSVGDWSFNWNVNGIARTNASILDYGYTCEEATDYGYACNSGTWVTNDIFVNYNTPWKGKFTFGALNAFNKKPVLDPLVDTQGFNTYLYDGQGRQIVFRYTQRF